MIKFIHLSILQVFGFKGKSTQINTTYMEHIVDWAVLDELPKEKEENDDKETFNSFHHAWSGAAFVPEPSQDNYWEHFYLSGVPFN
jgi:hypothetical protein